MKKPLIVLTGPTAAGKTHLSIALAKAVNGEIISADSMQVYKYMDIGSAKIRPEEMQGVKHYLVDELLPEEEFHIVKFQQMAKAAMEEIYAKGKVPILVGGTGFIYRQSQRILILPRQTRKMATAGNWSSWQQKKEMITCTPCCRKWILSVQRKSMPTM